MARGGCSGVRTWLRVISSWHDRLAGRRACARICRCLGKRGPVHMTIVAFGEVLLRLSPPGTELPLQSPHFDCWIGGAEANVLAQLAQLGHDGRLASVVPDNALGRGAIRMLRQNGIDTRDVRIAPEGRLGQYMVTRGAGARASDVLYDRFPSAFSDAAPKSWKWTAIFLDATWFHVSGITAAVSAHGATALREALTAARALGISISFDCNYRPSLWARDKRDPVPLLRDLLSFADVIFGNHNDFALLSGRCFEEQGEARRREAAQAAFDLFPNLQCIASTARHIVDAEKQTLSARIDRRSTHHQTHDVTLTAIIDRIGSGDAYCAEIGRAVQQECRDRSRMPSSA
eukprot:TRINITY_DN25471_c0_g1_i6.p1 TRINITY_DN25471_c0_g1~~TRINITY_DN25471_c0_g1_i6.p1  ORF type:complete len:346 (-),score=45.23 TRINITY_DN25471_c0_g1_i6:33-1070(-)